jgi:hypothetical protein
LTGSRPAVAAVMAGVDQLVRQEREQALGEVLAQLEVALDAAVDLARPGRSLARVASVRASVKVAARSGPDATRWLVNDLAKLAAGWRRER